MNWTPERFETAQDLWEYLNKMRRSEREAMYFVAPNGDEAPMHSCIQEKPLSDGSKVQNLRIWLDY